MPRRETTATPAECSAAHGPRTVQARRPARRQDAIVFERALHDGAPDQLRGVGGVEDVARRRRCVLIAVSAPMLVHARASVHRASAPVAVRTCARTLPTYAMANGDAAVDPHARHGVRKRARRRMRSRASLFTLPTRGPAARTTPQRTHNATRRQPPHARSTIASNDRSTQKTVTAVTSLRNFRAERRWRTALRAVC